MHDHDLDLIAAYADGSLDDPAAQAEAGRLIASCATCAAELRLQQAVKDWLEATPAVALTEAERSRLRTYVSAQTSPAPAASGRASTRRRRAPLGSAPVGGALRPTNVWMRLSAVAAGLFVLAAGGGILLSLGRQPDRDGFSSAEATATTAAAPTFAAQTTAAYEMAGEARLAANAGPLTRDQLPDHLEGMTERAKAGQDGLAAPDETDQQLFRCEPVLPGPVQERETATVDGQPAELYVYEVDNEFRADALNAQTCQSLLP